MAGQPTSSRNATFVWTMPPCCAWFCSIRWWLLSWSIFPSTCLWCALWVLYPAWVFSLTAHRKMWHRCKYKWYQRFHESNAAKPYQLETAPNWRRRFSLVSHDVCLGHSRKNIFAFKGIKLPRFQGFAALLVWSHSEGGLSTVFAEAASSGSSRIQTFDEHNDMERWPEKSCKCATSL